MQGSTRNRGWRKAHTPEIIQWLERFEAYFTGSIGFLFSNPYDAEFCRLLRKTVRDRNFGSHL